MNTLLTQAQYDMFRQIAKRHAGINIADSKITMVTRRVRSRMNAIRLNSFDDYCNLLNGPKRHLELQHVVNALTTNKTDFFREAHQFDHLALEALNWTANAPPQRHLKIWSAGCSTGEEPYTIAITLAHAGGPLRNIKFRILATDIDTEVVTQARRGIYGTASLASVPPAQREKYFVRHDEKKGEYQVAPQIKDKILFKGLNLHDTWPMKGSFDIVFCRNVMIYFDRPTQRRLYERFTEILEPGGLLYCGHSESLHSVSARFKTAGRCIYRKMS